MRGKVMIKKQVKCIKCTAFSDCSFKPVGIDSLPKR